MFLIVGLGNPGPAYEVTRHNAGFLLLDRLAERCSITLESAKNAIWGRGRVFGKDSVLLKPQTFMNLSGHAVAEFMKAYSVETDSILVAYDDCDLPMGRLRIRKDGGSGGHKGINSIVEHIGGSGFPRIRLGVGRPAAGSLVDYVLSPFAEEETEALDAMLDRGVASIEAVLSRGLDHAMNSFNSFR